MKFCFVLMLYIIIAAIVFCMLLDLVHFFKGKEMNQDERRRTIWTVIGITVVAGVSALVMQIKEGYILLIILLVYLAELVITRNKQKDAIL